MGFTQAVSPLGGDSGLPASLFMQTALADLAMAQGMQEASLELAQLPFVGSLPQTPESLEVLTALPMERPSDDEKNGIPLQFVCAQEARNWKLLPSVGTWLLHLRMAPASEGFHVWGPEDQFRHTVGKLGKSPDEPCSDDDEECKTA